MDHSTHSNSADSNAKNPLAEVKVFAVPETTLGLPSRVFWPGAIVSAGSLLIVPWFVSVIFTIVLFAAMYSIHANDPRAIEAWRRAFFRPTHWSGGICERRSVKVLHEREVE